MASRGRGRGRGSSYGLNLEAFGLKRGDAIPTATLEPPPVYPSVPFRPSPLEENEYQHYLMEIKQEMRTSLRNSRYFIEVVKPPKSIVRYSDKYELMNNKRSGESLDDLDERLFPVELQSKKASTRGVKRKSSALLEKIEEKLKTLDEKEDEEGEAKTSADEEENEDENEGEDKEKLEEVMEEEIEAETDYVSSYFDNGEGYLEDSDDAGEEGPTY